MPEDYINAADAPRPTLAGPGRAVFSLQYNKVDSVVTLFVIKLLLTPLLIAVATLVARKWGESVGGWLVGLPLTSGPVSVFLALEQGPRFAANAAQSGLFGAVGVAVFCLVYARLSLRFTWPVSSMGTLVCYGAAIWLLSLFHPSLPISFAATLVLLQATLMLIKMPAGAVPHPPPPWWDLPLRMAAATIMVLALTAGADRLGPEWSGLLAPFPVFTYIMVVFAHAQSGCTGACQLLRGVVVGCFAAAAFFGVVAFLLPLFPILWTYVAAIAAALAVNAVTFVVLGAMSRKRSV